MRVITERDEIRTVAFRWKSQYAAPHWLKDKEKGEIGQRLSALDPETATRQDVAEIIGNDGWIRTDCDECKATEKVVVHIGDEPDYEARWQQLCEDCVSKALRLIRSVAA